MATVAQIHEFISRELANEFIDIHAEFDNYVETHGADGLTIGLGNRPNVQLGNRPNTQFPNRTFVPNTPMLSEGLVTTVVPDETQIIPGVVDTRINTGSTSGTQVQDPTGIHHNDIPILWHKKTADELNLLDWTSDNLFLAHYDSSDQPIVAVSIDRDNLLIVLIAEERGIEYTMGVNNEGITMWMLSKVIHYNTCYSDNSIEYDVVNGKVVSSVETYKVRRRLYIDYTDDIITRFEYPNGRFGVDPIIGSRVSITDGLVLGCAYACNIVAGYCDEIVAIDDLSEDPTD